jgi:DNA-binding IclR family transcriptional regulator
MGGLDLISRADAVIRVLDRRGEATVAELAAELATPNSTVYRLLAQLQSMRWVAAGSAHGRYRLGSYFLHVGAALENRLDVRDFVRVPMRRLVADSGAASLLMIRMRGRAVCVDRVMPVPATTLAVQLGDSVPLYANAAAMVLFAFLPHGERVAALDDYEASDGGAPPRWRLERDLLRIREDGYALVDDGGAAGTASIGAPIFNHRGELVASLSLSGMREPLLGSRAALDGVVSAARSVSRELGLEQR